MLIIWTITQLERNTDNGFVTTAHWQATAADGEHTASIYSTSSWADGTLNIPYADLTQTTILGWVWANGIDKTAIENSLASQIEAKKNPMTSTGTPWSV